ncbi:MAG: DUF4037 domain-containing protein [Anaerolineae bacterium]
MTEFIPGITLCGLFFREVVKPIVDAGFPDLRYDAGLFGYGSEVLGYDTPRSMDHNWGLRVRLIVSEADYPQTADAIKDLLRRQLPVEYRGYSTDYSRADTDGSSHPASGELGNIQHLVTVETMRGILWDHMRLKPDTPMRIVDWLTIPQQHLLEMTSGEVYQSTLGDLPRIRQQFAYYPDEVWKYLLACAWMRISQEEPFVGRTGEVGDNLGSAVIGARLVRDLMRLCFLIERRYAPYSKWFGTAFSRLACGPLLTPIFQRVLNATTWQEREQPLSEAYHHVAEMQNALAISEPVTADVSPFWGRPFQVIHGDHFAESILKTLPEGEMRTIARRTRIGGIDQYTDNTDLIENPDLRDALTRLYFEGSAFGSTLGTVKP